MNASIHIVRNSAAVAVAVIGLVATAAIVVNGGLATVVAVIALSIGAAILPLVVIHYDQHDERLRRRGPGESQRG